MFALQAGLGSPPMRNLTRYSKLNKVAFHWIWRPVDLEAPEEALGICGQDFSSLRDASWAYFHHEYMSFGRYFISGTLKLQLQVHQPRIHLRVVWRFITSWVSFPDAVGIVWKAHVPVGRNRCKDWYPEQEESKSYDVMKRQVDIYNGIQA